MSLVAMFEKSTTTSNATIMNPTVASMAMARSPIDLEDGASIGSVISSSSFDKTGIGSLKNYLVFE